ncbi:discoidin domain-containing protein [Nocardiopsis sp. NPDC058631]|uniref:discoidin domain-containing protein n=1 Tax=Nocardiopsis sp. NPDC058631 TaxID=3346566 RepID=UPI0036663901
MATGMGALLLAAVLHPLPATAEPSDGPTALAEWDGDRAQEAHAADPAAATSSGSAGGVEEAGAAFDADAATRWVSDADEGAWLQIDLGTEIRVLRAQVDWDGARYGERYALEVSSDGSDWTAFYEENAGTGSALTAHTYPQEVVGRYVRLRGIESASGTYAVSSFRVLGGEQTGRSQERTNLALYKPAFGDVYQHAGNSPAFVTDGGVPDGLTGDVSRWATDWMEDRYVGVDLGGPSVIDRVDLHWESAFAVDYEVQVSDDRESWTTVHRPSAAEADARRADIGTPGSAAGLHDAITLDQPVTARYVRVQGLERRSFHNPAPHVAQFGYSLYEIEVWGTGGGDAAYPELPTGSGGEYSTILFDDFDGAELNRDDWRVITTGENMRPVNGESQAYVDSPDTVRVQDGNLVLHGNHCLDGCVTNGAGTFDFTSGRVDTFERHDFTYGRVSANIKLPVGEGYWPAFWLLGSNVDDPTVSWPASGEIDVMENIGYADWSSSSLHGPGYSADGNVGESHEYPAGGGAGGWHEYSVEWTPEAIRFHVDGVMVQETTRQKLESTRGQWVFDHDHYVILNLALGGAYPAGHNGVTEPYWGLPRSSVDRVAAGEIRAEIDWVRVEQLG